MTVSGEPVPFLPRLIAWTEEDRAAKGLRSLRDRAAVPEPPIHISVLEILAEQRCLLLLAPPGGGRTTLARHLVRHLGSDPAALAADLPRNEAGDRRRDGWRGGPVRPVPVEGGPDTRFADLLAAAGAEALAQEAGPDVLIVVDGAERIVDGWAPLLADAVAAVARFPRLRVLFLGETAATKPRPVPAGAVRHELLPLTVAQRRHVVGPDRPAALSPAASLPALFALALAVDGPAETAEAIVDVWSVRADAAAVEAARRVRPIGDLLDARRFAAGRPSDAVARFAADPDGAAALIDSLLARLSDRPADLAAVVDALLALPGDAGLLGAVAAARSPAALSARCDPVAVALLRIVSEGRLPPARRATAGRLLSTLGDPRDLDALATVPAGTVVMGSTTHPNATPPHPIQVAAFRIGVHPVTNRRFAAFVAATGRPWASPDGRDPDRANAPAVDLTWHDARAFCAWLTPIWRAEGRIGGDETVRLPMEPEWERAARGDLPDPGDAVVHPWGAAWDDDRANGEAAGLNDTCAVGLFPRGRSPWGCLDMAGQVWEWCTTLWGTDMAAPSFAYPWRDDGREDPEAPDAVRRVLRGGCFSSGPLKANVSYRGSLEANGFWRGNGFRIVVAAAGPGR